MLLTGHLILNSDLWLLIVMWRILSNHLNCLHWCLSHHLVHRIPLHLNVVAHRGLLLWSKVGGLVVLVHRLDLV